jgi:CheY-like chemotaxis protein
VKKKAAEQLNTLTRLLSSHPKWQIQAPAPESSKRLSILYIEEDEAFFRCIKAALENAGYGVVGVTNSWQAIALLLKSPICLVLRGELLCGADGTELAQRIKEIKPDVRVCERARSRALPFDM